MLILCIWHSAKIEVLLICSGGLRIAGAGTRIHIQCEHTLTRMESYQLRSWMGAEPHPVYGVNCELLLQAGHNKSASLQENEAEPLFVTGLTSDWLWQELSKAAQCTAGCNGVPTCISSLWEGSVCNFQESVADIRCVTEWGNENKKSEKVGAQLIDLPLRWCKQTNVWLTQLRLTRLFVQRWLPESHWNPTTGVTQIPAGSVSLLLCVIS